MRLASKFTRASSLVVASAILLQTGCASKTIIRSTDPQAKIYIEGEYRGTGTVNYEDTKIVGSSTTIRLDKDGCAPQTHELKRNEKFDGWACFGGVLVLFPFLWIMKYKSEHNYSFICEPKPNGAVTTTPSVQSAPVAQPR